MLASEPVLHRGGRPQRRRPHRPGPRPFFRTASPCSSATATARSRGPNSEAKSNLRFLSRRATSTATAGPTSSPSFLQAGDIDMLLGRGDGTFQDPVQIKTFRNARFGLVGRLQRRRPPLTSPSPLAIPWAPPIVGAPMGFIIFLGRGNSTFEAPVQVAAGIIPTPSWRVISTATAAPRWPSPKPTPFCWPVAGDTQSPPPRGWGHRRALGTRQWCVF